MSNDRYKFRGKRVDNGEWVYGDLRQFINGTMCPVIDWGLGCANVHPDSVGQFTGLKDKNKVEIYEGDSIGWCAYGDILSDGVVYFEDGCFRVNSDSDGFTGSPCLGFIKIMPCHVICNTTDDKNLLEN